MNILDGKLVKEEKLKQLKKKVDILNEKIGLAVIQIGADSASDIYISSKAKMAEQLNYKFEHLKLESNIKEEQVLKKIEELNNDTSIDGIIVQMPLPKHLDSKKIQNKVLVSKDVDGLTDSNMGRLIHNIKSLIPCTPMGIIDLLDFYHLEVSGKNIVIIGRSDLVGKPLAALLTNMDATVTLCHSKTKNLKNLTRSADIVVAAVGKAKFLKQEDIKEDAIVIDVGINRDDNGNICGDVDFENVQSKASYITPVPKGVGQMTVYELAYNTYKAHIMNKEK